MGYKITLGDILLPNWVKWGGNGVSDLPARNTRDKNKLHKSILISEDGVTLYNCYIDKLNTEDQYDEGLMFEDHIDNIEYIDKWSSFLNEDLLEECKEVHRMYLLREATYESNK